MFVCGGGVWVCAHMVPLPWHSFVVVVVGVWLVYNTALVSVVQGSESAICIHEFPPFSTFFLHPHPTHPGHHKSMQLLQVDETGAHYTEWSKPER